MEGTFFDNQELTDFYTSLGDGVDLGDGCSVTSTDLCITTATGTDSSDDSDDDDDDTSDDTPPCQPVILSAVNNQFGTNFTGANVQSFFTNGGALNLVITGTGLTAPQFNSIHTGRFPSSVLGAITGHGPSLHITGQTPLDPGAVFNKRNIGGVTTVTFTAHIDSAYAYNPLGALAHLFTDVLGSGTRNPCPGASQ